MKVFLIRHGETGGNVARRHQAEDTPLSLEGKRQAQEAAHRIKELKPTHILSSSLVRTVETASIIGQNCGIIPQTDPNFIELVRPKYLHGHYHHSLRSKFFYLKWFFGLTSVGESYPSLIKRIIVARDILAQHPDDARVVVVSHSVFINFFIAHMCNDEMLSVPSAMLVFRRILKMPNTHITHVNLNPAIDEESCSWSVEK